MEDSSPVAELQIAFQVPVTRVFEAFIDPEITTKFWFTHSDGRLEPGKAVNWSWETNDLTVPVKVQEVETNQRILIQWGEGDLQSTVEWTFTGQPDGTTLVKVLNSDFIGSIEEIVAMVIDSQDGFTEMLSKAKAFLEQDSNLNQTAHRSPVEL